MADARPVTDDWVERDIMVYSYGAFWRAVIAVWSDRLRGRGSLRAIDLDRKRYLGGLASLSGARFGRSNRIDASDGLRTQYGARDRTRQWLRSLHRSLVDLDEAHWADSAPIGGGCH